jgi:N-acylglucosamine 2-epimerase
MMNHTPLRGLVAATYTPMDDSGNLKLEIVGPMVESLIDAGVGALYVCGTTGEGTSLTTDERKNVLEAYFEASDSRLPVVAQVGHNCLADSRKLAEHAQKLGIAAFSANAPSYFKCNSVDLLVESMAQICETAPELPFYYYHIPVMTGQRFDMVEFLNLGGEKIPNLVGVKYSDHLLPDFQAAGSVDNGRFDIVWGCDDMFLGALATGARGAIGSTYNIAAPWHCQIIESFEAGDIDTAKRFQAKSVELVRTIARYPFHPAMKQILKMMGHDFGPCRLPQARLTNAQVDSLRVDLEKIGFFERTTRHSRPILVGGPDRPSTKTEPATVADPARREELRKFYRDQLLDDTMPFWLPRAIDREYGGFMVSRNRDGSLLDTDKGVWQQGRFTWLLGELYNQVEPKQDWLEAAEHGIDFLDRYCFDPSDGRIWFQVSRDGRPIRKRRYAFGESFAAIAYGEYAKATGKSEYAEKAADCFNRFLNHRPEPKFTDTRPCQSIGAPMITIVTASQLRESIGLDRADELIDDAIELIRRDFLKPDLETVMETVGANGEILDHFDGRTLNPGHAIEAAWFIMNEGKHRSDSDLIQTGATMLDWMWRRGWDETFGGILYFRDLHDGPVQEYWHDMKFWWPQNETIIATLMAYKLTGDEKYARWHQQAHDWAHDHFHDPDHGEWFGYLHRDGRVSVELKGNLWKGPFHMPRMQLICSQLLED